MADSGLTEREIMRQTNHKSARSARVYIDNTAAGRKRVANAISGHTEIQEPGKKSRVETEKENGPLNFCFEDLLKGGFIVNHGQNVTFNVHIVAPEGPKKETG